MARATTGIARVGITAAVAGLVAAFALVSPASAGTLSGSSFEVEDDANLVVDGGGIDWLSGGSGTGMRSGVLVRDDKPTGQHDDSFTQGTNINDTPTTITTGSIPNNKSDLTHFGVYVDRQADDAFVDVFWTRVQAPNGTTTMDFEFNQSATRQNAISPPANSEVDTHTIPLRTSGDMLITYSLAAGGTHPTLTRRTWNGSAWGAATSFSASDALAGINTTAISAAKSDGIGPFDPFTFGEASIRLSAFVPSSDTCTTFGSVYLRSRSSATDTDENKDFIAPEDVTISNCGSVTIHKTDAGGALPDAGFTLYKDAAPTGVSRGDEDSVAAGTCSSTDANGDCTITDVKKGQYWVVETKVPDGHDAAPDQHIAITAADQVVPLSFVDPIQPSTPTLSTTAAAAEGGGWDDSATLTGDGTHPVTGSVAFYVCGPASTATACASTAHKVGDDVTVSGGGATTSAPFDPGPAGWYCFRAVFTSSSPYYSNTAHSNDDTECFLQHNANLTVSKTAHAAFGRAYHWSVDKAVVGDAHVDAPAGTAHSFGYEVSVSNTHTDSAWTVTGAITVTNPNGVDFTGVDVSDAIDNGAGDCLVPDGADVTVPAHDAVQLGYTCTYSSAPSPAIGTNTATAAWDDDAFFTTAGSATGTATVDFSSVTPSTTNQVVAVSDTLKGGLGTLDAATADNPTVYSYSIEQTAAQGTCATTPNTASVESIVVGESEVPQHGDVLDTASADVSLCGGLPLGVEQVASGVFDRTYLWSIDKSVDRTRVTLADGGTATFAYTVTVTPSGTQDSGFAVLGTIGVTNPNDWEDVVVDVTASTDLGGGSTCVVDDGDDATVPAGQSLSFSYSCTFTSTPAMSGNVTALATWDAAAAATDLDSASAPSPVALQLVGETNRTITVVDDKTDPGHAVELGTATYDDGEHAFTYTLTKPVAGTSCTDYTNIATIQQTEQSDQQVVTVCGTFTGGGGGPVVTPPATGGGLPFTGDLVGLLSRYGLALLAGGGLLLLISRRRRA